MDFLRLSASDFFLSMPSVNAQVLEQTLPQKPSTAPSEMMDEQSGQSVHEVVLKYVIDTGDGYYFDQERAKNAGESDDVLLVGQLFDQIAQQNDEYGGEGHEITPEFHWREFYRYGNWCGLNHGSGRPIDALDEACMHHDFCYARTNFNNCGCDNALRDGAIRAQSRISAWGKANAEAIIAWTLRKSCSWW